MNLHRDEVVLKRRILGVDVVSRFHPALQSEERKRMFFHLINEFDVESMIEHSMAFTSTKFDGVVNGARCDFTDFTEAKTGTVPIYSKKKIVKVDVTRKLSHLRLVVANIPLERTDYFFIPKQVWEKRKYYDRGRFKIAASWSPKNGYNWLDACRVADFNEVVEREA